MTLIVSTVIVIALFIAVLAIYLFIIGALLNSTANNLGDCVQSMRTIVGQATVIGPGVKRINKAGSDIVGAIPLLVDGAERVAAKLAPSTAAPETASAAPSAAPSSTAPSAAPSTAPPSGVGYMDS